MGNLRQHNLFTLSLFALESDQVSWLSYVPTEFKQKQSFDLDVWRYTIIRLPYLSIQFLLHIDQIANVILKIAVRTPAVDLCLASSPTVIYTTGIYLLSCGIHAHTRRKKRNSCLLALISIWGQRDWLWKCNFSWRNVSYLYGHESLITSEMFSRHTKRGQMTLTWLWYGWHFRRPVLITLHSPNVNSVNEVWSKAKRNEYLFIISLLKSLIWTRVASWLSRGLHSELIETAIRHWNTLNILQAHDCTIRSRSFISSTFFSFFCCLVWINSNFAPVLIVKRHPFL